MTVLCIFCSWANAEAVSAIQVPQLELDMGTQHHIRSSYLDEQRDFYVRLPQDYAQTERPYPVIYLLDANNEVLTYMDNLYFHSVAQIDRMMKRGDIPESIIVGVPFKRQQWYRNVIADSVPFMDFIARELSPYVDKHFRTLSNRILVGQSYSAVIIINTMALRPGSFDTYAAIEPVLADGELEKSIAHFQQATAASGHLDIIMGGSIMLHEVQELVQQLPQNPDQPLSHRLELFADESHGSVYYPALNNALRYHFRDFRAPAKQDILTNNMGFAALHTYYQQRQHKYQIDTTDRQLQSAIFDTIFYNLKAKRFEQAFKLWPKWESPHKIYNANRIINYFERQGDMNAAISLTQGLAKAMPEEASVVDRLAALYTQTGNNEQARSYRNALNALLTKIFSQSLTPAQESSLNRFGYGLLQQQRHDEAISLFNQVVKARPDSLNAYDSLADAYLAAGNNYLASQVLEKALKIAQSKEGVDPSPITRKLQQIQAQDAE